MLPSPFDLIPNSARRLHNAAKGDVIFHQNDKTRGLYVLISGHVEMRRVTKAGHQVVIHRVRDGETFAEASMFSDHYHCDACAMIDSQLVEIERGFLLNKFMREPEFALAIAKRFAQQNQGYRRTLEIISIKNAEDRIFAGIQAGLMEDNIRVFAAQIGLTHEAVYRGLAALVGKNLLRKSGRGKYSVLFDSSMN